MRRLILLTLTIGSIAALLVAGVFLREQAVHDASWMNAVKHSVDGKSIQPSGAHPNPSAADRFVQSVGGRFARRSDRRSIQAITGNMMAAPPYAPAPAPAFNTEAYDRIAENGWKQAAAQPLSTFSIDVDTAAYANTRRFIDQGQAPPADAVRIEELINYFAYEYPQPSSDTPFSVTAEVAACPWRPQHRLALIGLQARTVAADKIPPRNLVFLIDVSGSMSAPNKLPLVREALGLLAGQLTERDRVAIVVYAGATGLVLPSTSGDDAATIREAIERLEAGGSTNGGEGLRLAYEVAREHYITGGVNRVILATDGDFNVGVTSQGELIRLVEEKRENGIALSVLGFGMGNYKDSTLEKLADHGDGNYAYIDSLREAEKTLAADANGTLVTIAKDVKLQVEFNPAAVAAYRLIGYENRALQHEDFNDDRKDAGDLGVGHSVTALYEIIPAGAPVEGATIDPLKYQETRRLSDASDARELMTIKLRYKQPDATTSRLMTVVVPDGASETLPANLGFSSSVAEFGMLLRNSEHKGAASWAAVLERARRFRGADPRGVRSEFIRLVESASQLIRSSTDGPGGAR